MAFAWRLPLTRGESSSRSETGEDEAGAGGLDTRCFFLAGELSRRVDLRGWDGPLLSSESTSAASSASSNSIARTSEPLSDAARSDPLDDGCLRLRLIVGGSFDRK